MWRRTHPPLFWCIFFLAVVACDDNKDDDEAWPDLEDRPGLTRLLDGIGSARIDMPRKADLAPGTISSLRKNVGRWSFEGNDEGPLYSGLSLLRDGEEVELHSIAEGLGFGASHGFFVSGKGGVGIGLDVHPGRTYEVEFSVRVEDGSDPPADSLLRVYFVDQGVSGWTPNSRNLMARADVSKVKNSWRQVIAGFVVPQTCKRAVVVLSPGLRGIVDDVRISEFDPMMQWLSTADEKAERFKHSLRRKLALGESYRDSLVMLPKGEVEFAVDLSDEARSLKWALGARRFGPSSSIRVHVFIEDDLVFKKQITLEGDVFELPFEEVAVDLEKYSGIATSMRFCIEGDPGMVALIAHPMIEDDLVHRERVFSKTPNLVLISLDTLRADHLPTYGYKDTHTPNLDRLGREGLVVENAISTSSYTLPTHTSLFSGLSPVVHGVQRPHERASPEWTPLLASVLREEGYQTAAFTGGGYLDPTFRLDAGFDRYEVSDPGLALKGQHVGVPSYDASHFEPDPLAGMSPVVDWLNARSSTPFFLFAHTYLIHEYRPRQRFLESVLDHQGEVGIDADDPVFERAFLADKMREPILDERILRRVVQLYDATIAQADEVVVGSVLRTLEDLGLLENTIVCVVSDHGDEFMEHGRIDHAQSLYREVLHVPWILYGPGIPKGDRFEIPVSLEMVAPTLLDLLGHTERRELRGASLVSDGLLGEREVPSAIIAHLFANRSEQWALQQGAWKTIRTSRDKKESWELFHWPEDLYEQIDRGSQSPESLSSMKGDLRVLEAALLEYSSQYGKTSDDAELSPEIQAQLKALGYLESDEGH